MQVFPPDVCVHTSPPHTHAQMHFPPPLWLKLPEGKPGSWSRKRMVGDQLWTGWDKEAVLWLDKDDQIVNKTRQKKSWSMELSVFSFIPFNDYTSIKICSQFLHLNQHFTSLVLELLLTLLLLSTLQFNWALPLKLTLQLYSVLTLNTGTSISMCTCVSTTTLYFLSNSIQPCHFSFFQCRDFTRCLYLKLHFPFIQHLYSKWYVHFCVHFMFICNLNFL